MPDIWTEDMSRLFAIKEEKEKNKDFNDFEFYFNYWEETWTFRHYDEDGWYGTPPKERSNKTKNLLEIGSYV